MGYTTAKSRSTCGGPGPPASSPGRMGADETSCCLGETVHSTCEKDQGTPKLPPYCWSYPWQGQREAGCAQPGQILSGAAASDSGDRNSTCQRWSQMLPRDSGHLWMAAGGDAEQQWHCPRILCMPSLTRVPPQEGKTPQHPDWPLQQEMENTSPAFPNSVTFISSRS